MQQMFWLRKACEGEFFQVCASVYKKRTNFAIS